MALPRVRDLYVDMILHGVDIATATHFVASYKLILENTPAPVAALSTETVREAVRAALASAMTGGSQGAELGGFHLGAGRGSVTEALSRAESARDEDFYSNLLVQVRRQTGFPKPTLGSLGETDRRDDPLLELIVAGGDLDDLPDPKCVKSRLPVGRPPTRDELENAVAACTRRAVA